MTLQLAACHDRARWNDFVNASPQGNVFCLTPFLDALDEDYELLVVEDEGDLQLGAVLIKKDGQPIRAPYPFALYHGVLLSQRLWELPQHRRVKRYMEVIDFLLAELEGRFDRISFCLHYRIADVRSFSWFHYHEPEKGRFQIQVQYTGLVDLKHPEDFDGYLASIRRVRRQEYQHAIARGIGCELSTDIDALDRLNALTFERQGIERDPHEGFLVRSIARAALDQGFGEIVACKYPAGSIVSSLLLLHDKRSAYALVMGNDPDDRKNGSGIYVFLENIRRYQAKGFSTFDFLGINSPNRGDFKTSLNATPTPYFVVTWERPA